MSEYLQIGDREIGVGRPTYVIAELSANHGRDLNVAVESVRAASAAGADAIKVQTYTPDTLTIESDQEPFRIHGGTAWDGRTLYDLYSEGMMPWDWQPKLKDVAEEEGLDFFSTAYDATAVDFLEELGVPVHKVASFEVVDLALIERMAATGKPMIISTGMASLAEIEDAVAAARGAGCDQLALLKCTSAYPASPDSMNLRTIPHLAECFGVPAGLSDHTLGPAAAIAAVTLGACIVEKHFIMSSEVSGPDAAFSMQAPDFRAMTDAIRTVERALGGVRYGTREEEVKSLVFRRSLFVVEDMGSGDPFTDRTVRAIRPGNGLPPRYLPVVLGGRATRDITAGTPMSWELLAGTTPASP